MPVFFGSDSAGVYYGRSLEPGYFLALQEKNLTALGVDAEARYSPKKHLMANLRIQYYHYSLESLEHYYQMPSMMAEAGIRYFYKEKLLTTLLLYYTGRSSDSARVTTWAGPAFRRPLPQSSWVVPSATCSKMSFGPQSLPHATRQPASFKRRSGIRSCPISTRISSSNCTPSNRQEYFLF
jgi:hypothetical protein